MQLETSPFSPEEAERVSQWVSSAEEARRWAGNSVRYPISPDTLVGWHRDPNIHPYLAWHDHFPVAYGELWVDRDENEVELARILVSPEQRGRGVGRAFVGKLIEAAGVFGLRNLILRVAPENVAAIRCYEASGFTAVSPEDQNEWNQNQPREYLWFCRSLK